jgi:hypothetical protein
MRSNEILKELESLIRLKGSRRDGTVRDHVEERLCYIDSRPVKVCRGIGKNHYFAQELWSSGMHEARIRASMIGDPEKVTDSRRNAGWQTSTLGGL